MAESPQAAGFVTGLVSEANLIHKAARSLKLPAAPLVLPAGGNGHRAYQAAIRLAQEGCTGLVSFGLAGGLDAMIAPGGIVLADKVIVPGGKSYPTDERWAMAVQAAMDVPPENGPVVGSDFALTDPKQKMALQKSTGAIAVDMESHGVAQAADELGLPLLVVRAVGDPAARAVPEIALEGFGNDGRTHAWPIIVALAKHPLALPALIRVARDSAAGMRALSRLDAGVFRALFAA